MTRPESSPRVLPPPAEGTSSSTIAVAGKTKKRVLFVDDEAAILEGLRAVLRPQRKEWDMVFALGGAAGLKEVQQSLFDVVVTDMRMPVIDGAELLRNVKELQPRAVRVVLSGQTDAEAAMKTVFTAHQFLAKPCDAEKLRGVVTRACELNALLCADELKALAGDVAVLPAAPRTYLAISRAMENPRCSAADVTSIVEREPALCAKVLQVVNSAFFGLPRAVSSVSQATSYLGMLALKNLALAMESVANLRGNKLLMPIDRFAAFQTNALLAGLIGRRWYSGDRRKADDAFVAGMLRDMGHLVLAARPEAGTAEGDQHAALSAYLLGLWGIPHPVLEAVAFHEQPERVPHEALDVVDVVHVADRIAAELAPSPFQPPPPELDLARLAALGAAPEKLDEARASAHDLLQQARELLAQ